MSLASILIKSLLTILIVVMASEWYIFGLRAYEQALARLMLIKNAELAFNLIKKDIQAAGYFGVRGLAANYPIYGLLKEPEGLSLKRQALLSPQTSPLYFENNLKESKPGCDLLLLHHVPIFVEKLAGEFAVTVQEVGLKTPFHASKHLVFLISDMSQAAIFYPIPRLSATSFIKIDDSRNIDAPLHSYKQPAEIAALEEVLYFVAKSHPPLGAAQPIAAYSLYRKSSSDRKKIEWLAGVEALQFEYGVFQKSGQLYYQRADEIADWSQIVCIKLHLLLVSTQEFLNKPTAYMWLDHQVQPKDRRLYQGFYREVALKNVPEITSHF